jgi:uncharacterized protein
MIISQQPETAIRTAVITGGHPYDVDNFRILFRSLIGIDAYVQSMDDFASSSQAIRDGYDVVLFYIMLMADPMNENLPWYAGKPKTVLEHLGEKDQGIVILHHSLLAYPQWPLWNEIVGITDRSFGFYVGETIHVDITNTDHPITKGLSGWEMVDETYTMKEAGQDSELLLTADHPRSMRTIAWTRRYKNAKVLCYQAGHDNRTWVNPSFRQVVAQGIYWAANRI